MSDRREKHLPQLTDDELNALREMPKPIADARWRHRLLSPKLDRGYLRSQIDLSDLDLGLTDDSLGPLYLFTRTGVRDRRDFTAGLALRCPGGDEDLNLVRCNGPGQRTPHTNVMEPGKPMIPVETCHVHFAKSRYLKARDRRHDGYAEPTDQYDDLSSAVDHLATLVNVRADGWADL